MALGERLRGALDKIKEMRTIDKDTVKEVVKEIQRSLISSDVEVSLVLELSKKIELEAFREDLPKGLSRREHIAKITYDYLVELLGGKTSAPENPGKILLVGLFGSGKTTHAAKLAAYYKKRGLKVGLIAADTFRPGAYEQLKQLNDKIQCEFYGNAKEKNAATVVREGIDFFKDKKLNLMIVDSAGRNALDEELVNELKEIETAFHSQEKWLVLPADIGQIAKKQASAFHSAVGVNGVIISRMDGSARGGGALTACNHTKSPVYFIGTGEKVTDLEAFNAERYLSKLVGYGDLEGLLEKVRELESEDAPDAEKFMKGEFSLNDFYDQLLAARKLGPMDKVAEMMGLGMKIPKDQVQVGEEKLEMYKVAMDSMTEQELNNPELLNSSRIKRIASGAGRKEEDVRELLRHYRQLKNMFKKFKNLDAEKLQSGKGMQKLMQSFQKKKNKRLKLK